MCIREHATLPVCLISYFRKKHIFFKSQKLMNYTFLFTNEKIETISIDVQSQTYEVWEVLT